MNRPLDLPSSLRRAGSTVLVLTLSAAACKGDDKAATPAPGSAAPGGAAPTTTPTTPSPTPPAAAEVVADACAVFTAAEVSAATGLTLRQGSAPAPSKTADGLPMTSCEWLEGDGPGHHSVNFRVENFRDVPRATRFFADSRVNMGKYSFAEVAGIADEALFYRHDTEKKVQARMGWRKGTVVYTVGVLRMDGLDITAGEAKLKALADSKF